MTDEEKNTEFDEILKRICVCRLFRLSGLQKVLKDTGFEVEPITLIWQVGDLNVRDYISLDSNISIYIVNQDQIKTEREGLQQTDLFCEYHDAWRKCYHEEFKTNFRVDDLAALLYHEAAYFKFCSNKGENVLEFLKLEVGKYLWVYCQSVAKEINVLLKKTSAPNDLQQSFIALISSMDMMYQDKRKEVADYIPQLSQKMKELNMFDDILSSSENETFMKFLDSLNP